MEKIEPKIHAEGFTDEQILNWMSEKLRAVRSLNSARQERLTLLAALREVDERISYLEISASMEFCR